MNNSNDKAAGKTQSASPETPTPARGQRRPVLISLKGERIAFPIPLERREVTIGRAIEADVRITDHRASRLHARIVTEVVSPGGETTSKIFDLGSTNGTLVNGDLVTEAVLAGGDKILIGDQLFRFEMLDDIDREFQEQVHRLLAHDELTG